MDSPTPLLEVLRSNSLRSVLQQQIEQMILSGELSAGQRINEVELAARFRTSRGPVREALRALEECGLLRAERNRGVFVREVSVAEADEIYDVREALDELIGQRLAVCITPQQLAQLRGMLQAMDAAAAAAELKRYHQLNLEFHEALVDGVGNTRLAETYRRLTKELVLFRLRGLAEGGGLPLSNAEHKAIVAAIAARDPARAGWAMRSHATGSRARMHKATEVLAAGTRPQRARSRTGG